MLLVSWHLLDSLAISAFLASSRPWGKNARCQPPKPNGHAQVDDPCRKPSGTARMNGRELRERRHRYSMICHRVEGMTTPGALKATKRRPSGWIFPLWNPEDHIHHRWVEDAQPISITSSHHACLPQHSTIPALRIKPPSTGQRGCSVSNRASAYASTASMASPTVLHVNLALTCVESVLYGIFFVLAITSLVVLVARRCKNTNGTSSLASAGGTLLSSPLVVGTLLLFITVGGHWCTTVLRLYQSMDFEGGQHVGDYYLMVELTPQVVATAFVVASVIVGDIILIYRVWIVWHRKLATVIFPALCTCAYIGAGISVVQIFAVFKPDESVFVSASKRRVITTAALTLSTNMYGTGCIAYRIWSTNRAMKHARASAPGTGLSEALVIFVESAALYTSWTFFFLMSYIAHSPLEAFAFHCIPAATGISFMLIVVRVGLGFSWAEHPGSQLGLGPVGVGAGVRAQNLTLADGAAGAGAYPLTMISLNVTQTVERETDFALPSARGKGDGDSDSAQDASESV